MKTRDPRIWMLGEAVDMLQRAERLHRQFFHYGPGSARGPCWEPPADVFETPEAIVIAVALPGVPADRVEIVVGDNVLAVVGERPVPEGLRRGALRRLEIPYGRFERRIELPPGHYEIRGRELADGCLTLTLQKLG